MHENTFSTDRAKIVSAARRDAKAWVKHYRTKIVETEASLKGFRNALADREAAVARLATAEAAPA